MALHDNLHVLKESLDIMHDMNQTMTTYYREMTRDRYRPWNTGSTVPTEPASRAQHTPKREGLQSSLIKRLPGNRKMTTTTTILNTPLMCTLLCMATEECSPHHLLSGKWGPDGRITDTSGQCRRSPKRPWLVQILVLGMSHPSHGVHHFIRSL